MPKKIKESKVTTAGLVIAALVAGATGGLALAPEGTTLETILEDCSIVIAGQEIDCNEAIDALNDQARANKDTAMMLDRNRQGIVCLNNDGEFAPETRSCVIDGDVYKWNGESFALIKTL